MIVKQAMKNIWTIRFVLLLSFVLFDFLTTFFIISDINQEGNLLAKAAMNAFGIHLGLSLFSLYVSSFLLLIILSCRGLLPNQKNKLTFTLFVVLDFCFGWFIAGSHFVGGTSWFLNASPLLRQVLGFTVYFLLILWFETKLCRKTSWLSASKK